MSKLCLLDQKSSCRHLTDYARQILEVIPNGNQTGQYLFPASPQASFRRLLTSRHGESLSMLDIRFYNYTKEARIVQLPRFGILCVVEKRLLTSTFHVRKRFLILFPRYFGKARRNFRDLTIFVANAIWWRSLFDFGMIVCFIGMNYYFPRVSL